MDTNTRSNVSRFSGFILFLLTLLVVGVLVILTVRAARDNANVSSNNDTSNVADTEGDSDFIIDGGATIDGDLGDTNNNQDDTTNTDDQTTGTGVVSTDDEDQNVDTRNDSTVAGTQTDADADDADDADDANTVASVDDTDSDSPDALAATGGAELPNTGAEAYALSAIVLGAMFYSYVGSRKNLIASLK